MNPRRTDWFTNLERKGPLFWTTVASLLVAIVGVLDVATGSEIAFSVFYLIPIALVAWFAGRGRALWISLLSAATWFTAEALDGRSYSLPGVVYWNAAVRLAFFVAVSHLLPGLRALEREKALARVDDLTGAANRRYVLEVAQTELDRSQRYERPLTIVFVDLDGFKAVNDRSGHKVGDRVLRAVVSRAQSQLRKTDTLGRLGGDEFVVLLPEADEEAARVAVTKLKAALLDEMGQNHWPVTFSIGVLTYRKGQATADDLIARADNLMYEVKARGKDSVAYSVWAG